MLFQIILHILHYLFFFQIHINLRQMYVKVYIDFSFSILKIFSGLQEILEY